MQTLQVLRRWGGMTTDALLDPACQIFQLPHIEGFIGFRREGKCSVVLGDPVCAPEHIPELVNSFHEKEGKEKNVIYLTVSEKFAQWAMQHVCKVSIQYGEELYLDPHADPRSRTGNNASLVRRKVRHAEKEGVQVKEYVGEDPVLEKELEEVGDKWLKGRKGPQVHISHVHLFEKRWGKRWFYAYQGDKKVGVVVLNQLQAKNGWLLNHLMITPDAPNGTQESLVIKALDTLREEGCHFVSFGAVPLNALGEVRGLGKVKTWIMQKGFDLANKFFHLSGHRMFWGKFHPEGQNSYLLFRQPQIGYKELMALKSTMNVSF